MTTLQPNPYGAGPRLCDQPIGDPSGEAVASLRGYSYQLYASALAWLDLRTDEELHLEVAEDYAIAAADALKAVQVKDTGPTSVTINSQGVQDTILSFVKLVEQNPRQTVFVRYLTTSPIGVERSTNDRASGKATLEYWREAATSADIAPIRTVLLSVRLPTAVTEFIEARSDSELRADLLKRIQWDCGQPDLAAIQGELAARLDQYGSQNLGLKGDEGRQLSGVVIKHILDAVVKPKPRRVLFPELAKLLEDATSLRVSRRVGNSFLEMAAAKMAADSGSSSKALVPRVLENERERPIPPILTLRKNLVDDIIARATRNSFVAISGASGMGKTVLARLARRQLGGSWQIVDLRNASAAETIPHLDQASLELPSSRSTGVILDDLNEIEDPVARRAVIRILSVARRNDILCFVTSYNSPSARALTELGLSPDVCVSVPDLSEDEVLEMVLAAGGTKHWMKTVYIAGGFGHPQLVSALITGLSARKWPAGELKDLRHIQKSDDVEAERFAARKQLVSAVPDAAKSLLYRVSIIIGRFDRGTVLSLANLKPSIDNPGEQLDLLIGPWVEQYSKEQLRVSPLLANAGGESLDLDEQMAVHRAIAEAYTRDAALDIAKANVIFLHGLRGKSTEALTRLAVGIHFADKGDRPHLSEWISGLRMHRRDRPIYPDDPRLSFLLRIAQMLLIANSKSPSPEAVKECWEAMEREGPAANDHDMQMAAVLKLLLDQELAGMLPDWIGKIVQAAEYVEKKPDVVRSLSKPVAGFDKPNFKGMMFLFQMTGIKSVPQLQGVCERLDQLPAKTRDELLSNAAQMPSDFNLIVNRAWQEQHERKDIDWIDCAERYLRMAEIAEKWGSRQLALRCHIARGVMFDEYAADPTQALAALDEAEKRHGADAILSRARAKIHYRRKDHSVALSLLRAAAKDAARTDHIEQSFMFREAGISAAETGDWREAAEWFGAAYEAASKSFDHMLPMKIGLLADQGVAEFKAGNLEKALRLLSDAVDQLFAVNPKSSIKAAYCHRVIRHAALCVSVSTTGKQRWLSDLQLGIVPGMCSNPEPADLSDLPFGHVTIVWYLLAEAEIAGGVDAGIAASVSDRLGGKRIANLDVNLREARIGRAIRECNVDELVAALDDWVASCIYLQELGDKFKEFTYESPAFGEICRPTLEQLALPIARATRTDSLLAFGMSAALQGRAEALALLKARAAVIGMEQTYVDLIGCMADCPISSDQEEYIVAAQINRVSKGGAGLQPDEVFVAGIRFIARLNSSNLKSHVIPLLGQWMRTRWAFALEHQTALLRSPASSRPAIEGAISIKDDTLAYCAHLSLTVASAATSRLGTSFKEFLTQLSQPKA